MRPKDAFGRYGCVPRNLHPAWQDVSWIARLIGLALFAEIDDFETCRIDVHGDWRESLCKRLSIHGKERRHARPALEALVAAGLLSVENAFVTVNVRQVGSPRPHVGLTSASPGTLRKAKLGEIVQKLDRQQASKASEVNTRAPAPTRTRELHETIALEYGKRYATTYAVAPPSDDTSARKLATKCLETARLQNKNVTEVVTELLDGLFASTDRKTVEQRRPLRFAAHDPGQYLRQLKPIVPVFDVIAELDRERASVWGKT